MKKIILISGFIFFYFFLYAGVKDITQLPKYVKDEIIVQFKNYDLSILSEYSKKNNENFLTWNEAILFFEKKFNLTKTRKYLDNIPFKCYKIKNSETIEEIIENIKKEEIVDYVEKNYLRYALYTPLAKPNDSYYQAGNMWGYNKVKADLAIVEGILNTARIKQIIVAVLDTGIGCGNNCYHEDLQGITITGKNILNPSIEPYDDGVEIGHGTFVAGIIAANTNNTTGIAGISLCNSTFTAKVVLMPVKVLDSEGSGSDADVYSGIVWAVDNGAKVLNLSFGGENESITLRNAVNYAYSKGVLAVAAAGNSNVNTFYPAAYSNVISVGATDINDKKTYFSNTGKIDVCAPGENIYSTNNKLGCNGYASADGTSFAAPFVSGLAALILLQFDGLSVQQVRNTIEQTADDVEDTGFDKKTGWGRINVYRALKKDFNKISEIKTYNWPNPFSPNKDINTNIEIIINQLSDLTIEIYDAGGDTVWKKQIKSSDLNYGHNTVTWDGKNSSGDYVSNGVYFYVVKGQGIFGKNKIAILY